MYKFSRDVIIEFFVVNWPSAKIFNHKILLVKFYSILSKLIASYISSVYSSQLYMYRLKNRIHANQLPALVWYLQGMMACYNFTTCSWRACLKSGCQTCHLIEAVNRYTFQSILYGLSNGLWHLVKAILIEMHPQM